MSLPAQNDPAQRDKEHPDMIIGVQHVAIDVDDLAAGIDFYGRGLGLTIAPRPEVLGANGIWFEAGATQIHLVESANFTAPTTGQHLALHVEDIATAIATIRERGIEVSDPFDIGAGTQAFLRDPAGNLVELNQPAPG